MAEISKIERIDKTLFVDDGQKRGPMTMSRVKHHPRENRVLAQVADRRLALFDPNVEPTSVKGKQGMVVLGELVCAHEVGWIRSFAVQPEGKWIVTGGSDRTLRQWAWENGRPSDSPVHQAAAHEGWVEGIAVSPKGETIVSVGADRVVKVWSAADLKLLETLTGHEKYLADAAFTHDGKRFITGGEDGRVIVWDSASLKAEHTISLGGTNDQQGQTPRHSGVHRLAVSHDDRWLAVALAEEFHLYDLVSGALKTIEKGNMDVALHPAANVIASGEGEVKLWSFVPEKFPEPTVDKNGRPIKPQGLPGKSIGSIKRGDWSLGLSFSPDGGQLALGKADGTLELYAVG